jgi:hypothetical protein
MRWLLPAGSFDGQERLAQGDRDLGRVEGGAAAVTPYDSQLVRWLTGCLMS